MIIIYQIKYKNKNNLGTYTWHNLNNRFSLKDCDALLKIFGTTVMIISKTLNNEIVKSKHVAHIFNCLDSMKTLSGLDETLWISCTIPINSEKVQFNRFNKEFKNAVVSCRFSNNTSLMWPWYTMDGHGSKERRSVNSLIIQFLRHLLKTKITYF